MRFAALNGHLEILKWARENGCPWDSNTCANAALNGHLEVLKWARENGCPWDSATCTYAAENGHLEVLVWAQENGCPWDYEKCLNIAKQMNHTAIIDWLVENKPEPQQTMNVFPLEISYKHETSGQLINATIVTKYMLTLPAGTRFNFSEMRFIALNNSNILTFLSKNEDIILPSGTKLVPETCDEEHILEEPLTVILNSCEVASPTKACCISKQDRYTSYIIPKNAQISLSLT